MITLKNFLLFLFVSLSLASCTIPVDIRNSGFFQERDLRDFADNWMTITSYQHSPGYNEILTRGLVRMTGRYRFEGDSRAGGATELGQIDLEINFAARDEPTISWKISNVTGLLPGVSDFGVGWSGEIPITGTVSVPEGDDPPVIGFKTVGDRKLTSIPRRDGEVGSSREVHRVFSGTFAQEFESGIFPLSVSGTVQLDGPSGIRPNNQFYLEQTRWSGWDLFLSECFANLTCYEQKAAYWPSEGQLCTEDFSPNFEGLSLQFRIIDRLHQVAAKSKRILRQTMEQ